MSAHDNSTNNQIQPSEFKNKDLLSLDKVFKTQKWELQKNKTNWIYYTRKGDETTYFEIKISSKDQITVSAPIKNTIYQFVTTFNNYSDANAYIKQKLLDYSS